jgi:hypothetical protein
MGFLDRFAAKKPAPQPSAPTQPVVAPAEPVAESKPAAGGVLPQLAAARAKLKAADLPGALAIYEEVIVTSADRSDVLVTISGDLGSHGHIREIVELLAPRYDVQKHGAAAGINLLQAYLATRNAEAAQHLLDLLFDLRRPDLEARLVGFSNALSELFISEEEAAQHTSTNGQPTEKKINLASMSKPLWFYGLEELAPQLLPRQEGKRRRVAFAQCALLGIAKPEEIAPRPEDELTRLSRGLPLWLADTFTASAGYEPIAAIGLLSPHYALFPAEWSADNLRQLNESSSGGLDYVVTGALRNRHADYELVLRIWEVKKFRELKTFSARWTPASADETLRQIHGQLCTYMEWRALPAGSGLAYAAPAAPLAYAQGLGASLTLFLAEKGLLAPEQSADALTVLTQTARANPEDARSQLALVAALLRLKAQGQPLDPAALRIASEWLATPAAQAADASALAVKLG